MFDSLKYLTLINLTCRIVAMMAFMAFLWLHTYHRQTGWMMGSLQYPDYKMVDLVGNIEIDITELFS